MQALAHTQSRRHPLATPRRAFNLPPVSANRYRTLQQEVDLGIQALSSKRADMAVTFFQSALPQNFPDRYFYDHLVPNLLSSYLLLIEQLLKHGDTATARDFLRGSLSLEVRGQMADDATFLRRFAHHSHRVGSRA